MDINCMSPNIKFKSAPPSCKAKPYFAKLSTSCLCWQNCLLLKGRNPLFLAMCYHKGCSYHRCFFRTSSPDTCPVFSCEVLLQWSKFYWKHTSSAKASSNPFSENIFLSLCASEVFLPLCHHPSPVARVTVDLSVSTERLWASGGQSPGLIQLCIPPTKMSSASRSRKVFNKYPLKRLPSNGWA